MEKHCERRKGFKKEGTDTAARNATLEKFIRDYGERAFRFAFKLSGNTEAAKELVQQASYRVLLTWDKYDDSRPLKPWFFTILSNAFLDSHKRTRQQKWVALDAPVDGEGSACYGELLADKYGDFTRGMEDTEAERAARHALRSLRRDYRAVIELCEMNGMKYEDVARSLGVPVGTVRSRVFRARRALRKCRQEIEALAP